ncbi:hypothetical protein UMC2_35361 [[Clostridium] sordellii]|uniref:hypothetical protein n=1 Tax=Paraclostridium sordellii TaxID=1505 RepID=UPI00054424E0|nr:hypothetical protein [Paeniclostridium sordellii]CEK34325.1 hypothetical protein UMC2_35361 [[Clostridium] sordellii] [Paeniclostridium sordellii]
MKTENKEIYEVVELAKILQITDPLKLSEVKGILRGFLLANNKKPLNMNSKNEIKKHRDGKF